MNRWFILCMLLLLATPAHAYRLLWSHDVGVGTIGYAYTQFYSITGDDEFWAPTHNLGADLDGDGVLEFLTVIATSGSGFDAYITNAATGDVEFTYHWVSPAGDKIQLITYLDAIPTDSVSEVMIQTLYKVIVISGGSALDAAEPDVTAGSQSLRGRSAPNPFGVGTAIQFSMPVAGRASVRVYDADGRLVRRLMESAELPAGDQVVSWDGKDDAGAGAAAGVYFARIEAGGSTVSQKMVRIQ